MEEERRMPPIAEGEKVPGFLADTHWYEIEFGKDDFLDFEKEYHPPRYTLSHGGVKFANLGDLHVITGKSGHGKTSFMSCIMAAILSGKCEGLYYEQYDAIPNPSVLYIDTEMGEDDTIAIKNRVCSMAGLDYTQKNERFHVMRLRETEQAADRWKKILKAIWMFKPTVCLIDGVLDIVNDYNNQEECGPIIRQCMMMATEYDASVWCVLHENPTFEKMVGTLGSILQRKVTEVFAVRKTNQSKIPEKDRRNDRPKIYFTVDQLKARGRDVEMWDFEIDNRFGWGVVRGLPDKVQQPEPKFQTKHTIEEVKQWITDCQLNIEWPAYASAIYKEIFDANGVTDRDEQKELFRMSISRRFLKELPKDVGQTHAKFEINSIEIPFAETKDETPF